jgi:acyl phosphate:glycerol-3-phosphate acyltransferase
VIAWLLVPGAYLIGAIPTSYVAGKVTKGLDLRQHGSGNLGATNAFRVLGWRVAVPVFVVDILKGWFPTAVFPLFDGAAGSGWALVYGAAAIVGHVFSIYVGFKGGKGVATGAGVFLALAPLAVLVGLAVWVSLVILTRIVSVASIVAAAVLPLAVLSTRGGDMVFLLSVVLALFVIYMHRANIGRLVRGEEHRFRARRRPAP